MFVHVYKRVHHARIPYLRFDKKAAAVLICCYWEEKGEEVCVCSWVVGGRLYYIYTEAVG
jgi:hypothetical protein